MRSLAHEVRRGVEPRAVGDAARGQVADRRLRRQEPGRGLGELARRLVVLDEHAERRLRRVGAQPPERCDHERQQWLGDARGGVRGVERAREPDDLVARGDGVGEQVGRRGVRARVDDGDTIGNEVHRKCPGSPARRKDTGARFPARRALRLAADPLGLVRRRRPGRSRARRALGLRSHRGGRRQRRRSSPTAGNPLAVGELRSFRGRRPHRPDLRALRRAERRADRGVALAPVRARGARRPSVRARCLRRQGQLPAAAARGLPPGARRRAAGARARARRGRGGGRRPPRARLARGGRARRRLRDRVRLGHGGRGHARAHDRRARDHAARDRRAHGAPQPALGHVRRRGAEREPRADAGARTPHAERRRAAARRAARRPDRADRRRAGVVGATLDPARSVLADVGATPLSAAVDGRLLRAQLVRAELRRQRLRERRRAEPPDDPARHRPRDDLDPPRPGTGRRADPRHRRAPDPRGVARQAPS